MPEPIALCIEDLEAEEGPARFLRCVALVGRGPGLRLTAAGEVAWQAAEESPLELWVSQDDRLILFRRAGGPATSVTRMGRAYEVPEEKPVVLKGGDDLQVGERRLRVHLHGAAGEVAAPALLPERARPALAKVAAAALALGTVVGGPAPSGAAETDPPLEVRSRPPDEAPPPRPDAGVPKAPKKPAQKKPSAAHASRSEVQDEAPLEVRDKPPEPMPRPRPDAGAPKPAPKKPAPK
jgi:hypothetical protein